jgi:pilus assembly protein CpaB
MYRIAIAAALLLSILGTTLLYLYVQRFEIEKSGGAPIAVLVAAQPVKRDAILGEPSISVREIPAAYVDSRAIRASEKKKVVGVRAVNAIQPGQTLAWTDVAVAGERRVLSSLVQPGFRAFNMKTKSDASTFDLIEPGDRVDLISTVIAPGGERTSSLLLQNVLVLAVGTNTGDEVASAPAKGPAEHKREHLLTLSVKPESAQLLAVALEKGSVSVAVRNPDDVRVIEGAADVGPVAVDTTRRSPEAAVRKASGSSGRATRSSSSDGEPRPTKAPHDEEPHR